MFMIRHHSCVPLFQETPFVRVSKQISSHKSGIQGKKVRLFKWWAGKQKKADTDAKGDMYVWRCSEDNALDAYAFLLGVLTLPSI